MKKKYIVPQVREIELLLPTLLAGSNEPSEIPFDNTTDANPEEEIL